MPWSAGQVFAGMFSTHPPLSDRIAALAPDDHHPLANSQIPV